MIVDIIRPIAQGLTPVPDAEGGPDRAVTFYHMELYEMNENDSPAYPFVHLVHPIRGRDKITAFGVESTTYPLKIFFLTKSLLQKKMVEREGEVNKMILLKDEFIRGLLTVIATPVDPADALEYTLKEVVSAEHQEMFNEFDSNMDGILLDLVIVVENRVC